MKNHKKKERSKPLPDCGLRRQVPGLFTINWTGGGKFTAVREEIVRMTAVVPVALKNHGLPPQPARWQAWFRKDGETVSRAWDGLMEKSVLPPPGSVIVRLCDSTPPTQKWSPPKEIPGWCSAGDSC